MSFNERHSGRLYSPDAAALHATLVWGHRANTLALVW